jgi:hypothetical protein
MNRKICQADFPFFFVLAVQNPVDAWNAVLSQQKAAKIDIPGQRRRKRNPTLESSYRV